MKKLFCLLLSLCLVAGVFAGMGVTAYADGDTQLYTVTKDDGAGVAAICKNLGVDFNANREWIQKTNKLSANFFIRPGMTLTLPAAGKVLTYVAPTSEAATVNTTTTTATTTTTTTTNGVSTIQYTLKSGDFVINICKALGIDFAANQEWIKAANNITNFNNLKVGRVLTLPAPGTTPALSTATGTSAASNAVSATNLVSTTTTTASNLLSGDSVSYYLVNYVVRSGDTLGNICSNYGANMDTVVSLNGIKNAARISVGQVLKIPTTIRPTSGAFTQIVAHTVVSGDTVGALCTRYGISYEANAATIKALNNRDNLNAIKVGQTLLFPVPSTVAVASTGTTATNVGTTTTTSTTMSNKYYTLNQSGAVNGTYSLTVNGQSVNGAASGQTVHVVATPDFGYKLGSITVVRDGISTAVDVDANNNFVMPACNVRVSVTFAVDEASQPHSVYNSSVSEKNVIAVVNGVAKTSVAPGQAVRLVLSDLPAGTMVEKIIVTTENQTARATVAENKVDTAKVVALASDYSFVMPSSDVFVTVLLKSA